MVTTRFVRAAGVAGAAVLLSLTAACGSSASSSSSSASGDAGSSGSSSPDGDASSAAQLTKSDIFAKIVAAQKDAGSYTFTLSSSVAGMSTKGSGKADVSGGKPAADATVTVSGQSIRTITADGFIYIKSGALGTDKWVKIDPSDKSGPGALFGSSADPGQQLKVLSGASKVTEGDSEKVDGVDTTEYVVTIAGTDLARTNPTLKQLASSLPKTIEYDVFVDKDNLLRKLQNQLTVSGQKVVTEIEFSDYGKDVSVSPPPAGQTTTKFNFGSLGGASTS